MPAGKLIKYVPRRKYKKAMPFSKRQVKAIKKIAIKTGEVKTIDTNTTDSSLVLTSGMSIDMPTIAQGDTDSTRDGDLINLDSLQYRIRVNSGTANGLVRCVVVQFGQQQDGDSSPFFEGNLDPTFLYPDLDTIQTEYKVLYDSVKECNPQGRNNIYFKIRIPKKKLKWTKVEYSDSAGLSSDIIRGKVFCKLYTNNTTASQMTAEANSRLKFYD